MKLAALCVMAFLTIADPCSAQDQLLSADERAQGEASVKAAASHFARSMREPTSATFRKVFIGKRPPPTKTLKVIVCGEVNGRNGYGGFTGFQPFIVSGREVHVGKVVGLSVFEACYTNRIFDTKDYSVELKGYFDEEVK